MSDAVLRNNLEVLSELPQVGQPLGCLELIPFTGQFIRRATWLGPSYFV